MKRNTRNFLISYTVLTILSAILLAYLWLSSQASVMVEWTTASELDTIGFNLLRGEVKAGPFEQVNQGLIPASADALTGSQYSFKDTAVKPGRTYFYMLEDMDAEGNTHRNGPIEVQAAAGGWVEWGLTAALVMILGWGWFSFWRNGRKPAALPGDAMQ